MALGAFLKGVGIYRLYEKWLQNQIKNGDLPQHIGIILDGNRRWAMQKAVPRMMGHTVGAKTGEEFLDWCLDLGIRTLTIWIFSTENFNRSKEEVHELFDIVESEVDILRKDPRIHQHQIRVKAIGRTELLPESIQKLIKEVELTTQNYDRHFLNVAIAYGGRAEIVDAVKKIAEDLKSGKISAEGIDEEKFRGYLYTAHLPNPYPDLVIRTSGEERLSGFLLWQSAYSEFCFLDVYWPGFRRIDLLRAVRIYQNRRRRFGK